MLCSGSAQLCCCTGCEQKGFLASFFTCCSQREAFPGQGCVVTLSAFIWAGFSPSDAPELQPGSCCWVFGGEVMKRSVQISTGHNSSQFLAFLWQAKVLHQGASAGGKSPITLLLLGSFKQMVDFHPLYVGFFFFFFNPEKSMILLNSKCNTGEGPR